MKNQKKLFENVNGNQFKLLTECAANENVAAGVKKLFSNGEEKIKYSKIESIGLGYVRGDVSTAHRVALNEAKKVAESYGYMDDEQNEMFVKSENHDETDMSNPEEKREVQIGKEILRLCQGTDSNFPEISDLAKELIQMHGAK